MLIFYCRLTCQSLHLSFLGFAGRLQIQPFTSSLLSNPRYDLMLLLCVRASCTSAHITWTHESMGIISPVDDFVKLTIVTDHS
jgi:hypothetical protein